MYDLYKISTIKEILREHDFRISKGLGQNFIIDRSVCPRMAERCLDSAGLGVIEVGPGLGTLTRELAKRAVKVVSIELDSRLPPILKKTTAEFDNVKIIQGDVLKMDLNKLIYEEFADVKEVRVCANLPYYITSNIIMKFLEENVNITSIVAMVQKEAAERMCAIPGTRECGAISLSIRYHSDPEIIFKVPRNCFYPVPNVDSSVIKIDLKTKKVLDVRHERNLFRIIKAAFMQRRKVLQNALSSGLGIGKNDITEILSRLGISPSIRAEQLTLDDFTSIEREVGLSKQQIR